MHVGLNVDPLYISHVENNFVKKYSIYLSTCSSPTLEYFYIIIRLEEQAEI